MGKIHALDALDELFSNLDKKYQKNFYRTSDAFIEDKPTRDQYGRSLQARVTVDGVSGYQMNTYGADIGKGSKVEVVNIGQPAAAEYRIASILPGIAGETPQAIITEFGGIDLLNLAGIRVRSSGFIILGGDKIETADGDIIWAGGRIEERKFGIEGYNPVEDLMFGLYTEPRAYQLDANTTINFAAGDFHVGILRKAHLRVDTALGKLQWLSGNTVLFESYLVDGNPFNHMAGLLRVAATHIGEGIEIGKLPGGPYVIQMLNKEGVPMFLVRVGFDTDPGHYYLRIGRPDPSPHIELTEDTVTGEPIIKIGGATISQATIELAQLIGTIGTDNLDMVALATVFSPVTHSHTLDGLSDVVITSVGSNEILSYDSGSGTWINKTLAEAGVSTSTRQITFTVEGNVAVSSNPLRIYNNFGVTLTFSKVFLSVNTVPTGAAIIVDINKGGTTIFTNQANRPQIAASANTGNTTTFDVTTWADGDYLTMDVDQVGSTIVGANMTIHIICTE